MFHHLINRPPTPTRQTLAVTLYVPYFIVHKGSSATVCLHFVAYCCFLFSKETSPYEKLTAYNADVQKYMQQNRLSTQKKYEIIDAIRQHIDDTNQSFESLFPSQSKRKGVMDHIIYMLSGNGICKISAETLADKANCSIRTVTDTVRALKQTGEILVAGLADGKNKYVFVLKTHPNFTTIMKEVFYINANQIAERTAEQVAEQKNPETVEAVGLKDEKTSSNYTNSISSFNSLKQEKIMIKYP